MKTIRHRTTERTELPSRHGVRKRKPSRWNRVEKKRRTDTTISRVLRGTFILHPAGRRIVDGRSGRRADVKGAISSEGNNRYVRTQRLCMYTWAERSVMRCSQACVAVYLRTAHPRSIPRRCPSTCSCRRGTRSTTSRSTRPGSRLPETAINPRRFLFPCRGTAVCIPAGT